MTPATGWAAGPVSPMETTHVPLTPSVTVASVSSKLPACTTAALVQSGDEAAVRRAEGPRQGLSEPD